MFPLDLTSAAMFQRTSVTFPWLRCELHALSSLKQVIVSEVRSVTRISSHWAKITLLPRSPSFPEEQEFDYLAFSFQRPPAFPVRWPSSVFEAIDVTCFLTLRCQCNGPQLGKALLLQAPVTGLGSPSIISRQHPSSHL